MLRKHRLSQMVAALAFAALMLPIAGAAAQAPDLDPPVWVVRDPDTTIYLFGTIHLLDGKSEWFNDEVKTAFDSAGTLVLEALLPENPAEMQALVTKYALQPPGTKLSDLLSPQVKARLDPLLVQAGIPPASAEALDAWFLASTLTILQAQKLGYTSTAAPEAILTLAAQRSSKALAQLESGDLQFALLDALPKDQQVALLISTIDESAQLNDALTSMIKAWGEGDSKALARMMNSGMTPELHKVLLTDRNTRWAEWIATRLAQPGTTFVAVGAGHLAGSGSVQQILKKRGIKVRRVD